MSVKRAMAASLPQSSGPLLALRCLTSSFKSYRHGSPASRPRQYDYPLPECSEFSEGLQAEVDTEKDALGGQAPAKPGRVSRKPKEDAQSPGRQRRTRKPETERDADNKGGDFFSSDLPKKLALLLVITPPMKLTAFNDASVS